MQVEIWSDIACPWCYVGKRRFEAALAGFPHRDAVTVTWHSFELDPNAPRHHDMPQPELLARKYGMSVAEAQAMNARMTEAATAEGLTFRLDEVKVGNTFDAHRVLPGVKVKHACNGRIKPRPERWRGQCVNLPAALPKAFCKPLVTAIVDFVAHGKPGQLAVVANIIIIQRQPNDAGAATITCESFR